MSRNSEIEYISRRLKLLAGNGDCSMFNLLLSQLNRACETRADKRPMLSDLRDSGSIESDADIVAVMYRDNYYEFDSESDATEVILRKNRHGRLALLTRFYNNRSFTEERQSETDYDSNNWIEPNIEPNLSEAIPF